MSETTQAAIAEAVPDIPDAVSAIASLHAAGAAGFDRAGMHYLDTLAARAAAQRGPVQRVLGLRLTQAVAAFRTRFALAGRDAEALQARIGARHPAAAAELARLHAAGDFTGMRRLAARLEAGEMRKNLRALVAALDEAAPAHGAAAPVAGVAPRPELRAIRNFRSTWSRLSVDQKVSKAIGQAPKNAGPINSHMLALRSLTLMRDISPDYLNRFISYAETLLALEHEEPEKPAKPKKRPAAKSAKK